MPVYKLQTSDKRKYGTKAHIPYADPQVVEFDADGLFEATLNDTDELTSLLVDVPDFSLQDEPETDENADVTGELEDPIEPQTDEENELGKSENEGNDIGNPDENDELLASLDSLRMPDLKQVAEDSGFPKEQWETLNKPELKNYLKEKLKSA